MQEKSCENCYRRYCLHKNKFVLSCSDHLPEYRTKIEKPGIRERQFSIIQKILENSSEITFSDLTALVNREVKTCRQTVSKLAQDIGQVTGHKKQGHVLKKRPIYDRIK